jgi:hypothetical protein
MEKTSDLNELLRYKTDSVASVAANQNLQSYSTFFIPIKHQIYVRNSWSSKTT